MKTIQLFLCLFFFSFAHSHAQLPVVYAKGFDEKIVDWPKIKAENDEDPENDLDFFYNDCAMEIEAFRASSTLEDQKDHSYHVRLLTDENPMTAWVPKGDGIGATFEVLSGGITSVYNGYQANPKLWEENSRVKKMKVYSNGKPLCYLVLEDKMGGQFVDLPGEKDFSDYNKQILKFEILETYKGTKYRDVAISEIVYSGCCFSGDAEILIENKMVHAQNLSENQKIISLDTDTGKTFETTVLKTAETYHGLMLKICTSSKSITITPEHPLFVKDYGFVSLKNVKNSLGLTDYDALSDHIEILIWDSELQQSKFETLKSVTPENGKTKAYSIRKLQTGETYIVNGFITKTY